MPYVVCSEENSQNFSLVKMIFICWPSVSVFLIFYLVRSFSALELDEWNEETECICVYLRLFVCMFVWGMPNLSIFIALTFEARHKYLIFFINAGRLI